MTQQSDQFISNSKKFVYFIAVMMKHWFGASALDQ